MRSRRWGESLSREKYYFSACLARKINESRSVFSFDENNRDDGANKIDNACNATYYDSGPSSQGSTLVEVGLGGTDLGGLAVDG